MLQRMLDERDDRPYPASLRCVLLGGGPAPEPLLRRCAAIGVPVVQTYGLTETASQIATLAPDDALRKLGSAGKPLFGAELRIVGEDGAGCVPGEPARSSCAARPSRPATSTARTRPRGLPRRLAAHRRPRHAGRRRLPLRPRPPRRPHRLRRRERLPGRDRGRVAGAPGRGRGRRLRHRRRALGQSAGRRRGQREGAADGRRSARWRTAASGSRPTRRRSASTSPRPAAQRRRQAAAQPAWKRILASVRILQGSKVIEAPPAWREEVSRTDAPSSSTWVPAMDVMSTKAPGPTRRVSTSASTPTPKPSEYAYRAARKPARGGVENARFVVASVEQLPPELDGIAALSADQLPLGQPAARFAGARRRDAAGADGAGARRQVRDRLLLRPAARHERLRGRATAGAGRSVHSRGTPLPTEARPRCNGAAAADPGRSAGDSVDLGSTPASRSPAQRLLRRRHCLRAALIRYPRGHAPPRLELGALYDPHANPALRPGPARKHG